MFRRISQIVVNGYNGYDLYTASNMISLPAMDYKTEEELAAEAAQKEKEAVESASGKIAAAQDDTAADTAQSAETVRTADTAEEEDSISFGYFMAVCMVCALLVFGMVLSLILILRSRKGRRRKRR